MKTKLLRKVRKRYSIVHYPKGKLSRLDGEPYGKNKYFVEDSQNKSGGIIYFTHKRLAIQHLIALIKRDYSKTRDKSKYKGEKIWYNG